MSNHYTFTLNLKLKRNLTATEITVLDYILNGNGTPNLSVPNLSVPVLNQLISFIVKWNIL
jgi:hypothetical protein